MNVARLFYWEVALVHRALALCPELHFLLERLRLEKFDDAIVHLIVERHIHTVSGENRETDFLNGSAECFDELRFVARIAV